MTESQEQRKVNPLDQIVDSYRQALRTTRNEEAERVVRQDKGVEYNQIDPLHKRMKMELDGIRTHIINALNGLENELSHQQKSYHHSRMLIEKETQELEALYQIKVQANTLGELQDKQANLEKVFQQHYDKLQLEFEARQVELANIINVERKTFEEMMFEKRQEWEQEMDSLEGAFQKRKKEFESICRDLEKDVQQKRLDWSKEESLLEKEYHQRRLKFDQQMAEYESSFEVKARSFREKELASREEFVKREHELHRKVSELEERKTKLEDGLRFFEKQVKDRRVQEDEAFAMRKEAFEKELEEKKALMMDDYLKKRDSVVDQSYREEKEKVNAQIAEFKVRYRALQKTVEDAQADKLKLKEAYERELERIQKDQEAISERNLKEKIHLESKMREKLEKEFYGKLQEVEVVYTQEITELKRYNQLLESQLTQERSAVKRMEAGMRNSDIQLEQIMVNGIEHQTRPAFTSASGMTRNQRIVRPSRFREE